MLKPHFTAFCHRGENFSGASILFPDPRCRTFAAIGVTLGGIGLSYGLSQLSQPTQPNLAASSAQMAATEAELLPIERQMQAEAQLGGTATLPGFTKQTYTADQAQAQRTDIQSQIDQLNSQLTALDQGGSSGAQRGGRGGGQGQSPQQQRSSIQGQISNLQSRLQSIPEGGGTVYFNQAGEMVPASQATQNFAGFSTADIEGQLMKELAQGQLTSAQKYDPQFIAEALAQEQQADPQGFAARQQLYDLMQKQIANPPTSPVSNEMEKQVEAKVAAGSGLTPDEQAMLDSAIAARGGTSVPADFSRDLTTGFAGEGRALANAGAGTSWLASGETPEDIQFRTEQQNLANLGQYVSGRTPQSEFRSLSGAQSGPTPVTQGAPLPTLPGNAAEFGAQGAIAQYGAQLGQAQATPNPWMTGLSGLLGVGNTIGAMGYKPFGGG